MHQIAYKRFLEWFYLSIIGCCWTVFSRSILIYTGLPHLALHFSYYMLENRPRNIYGMVCYSCLLAPPNTKECKCSAISMHFIWFWLAIIWKLSMNCFSDDYYVWTISTYPVKEFLLPSSLANYGRKCWTFGERSESLMVGPAIFQSCSSFCLLTSYLTSVNRCEESQICVFFNSVSVQLWRKHGRFVNPCKSVSHLFMSFGFKVMQGLILSCGNQHW